VDALMSSTNSMGYIPASEDIVQCQPIDWVYPPQVQGVDIVKAKGLNGHLSRIRYKTCQKKPSGWRYHVREVLQGQFGYRLLFLKIEVAGPVPKNGYGQVHMP
jgi:hypothetical protein